MSKNYHDEGQEDASEGVYNPPHSHVEELFTWTSDGLEEIREDREQYNDGYHHHESQKK